MKTLLAFDGDGTCWAYNGNFGSSFDALANVFGVYKEHEALIQRYYDKPELDEEWFEQIVRLFEGCSVALAEREIFPIPYSEGLEEFVESVRERRDLRLGLITSGVDFVARRAASALGLDFCHCNVLHVSNGVFTGSAERRVPLWEKHVAWQQVMSKDSYERTVFVGDTRNDVSCMKLADLAVAYNPKDDEVRSAANFVIDDFRQLEKILR